MNPRLKTFFTGLAEAGLLLTAVFSIVTIFDEWHYYVEMFSHFRLQYFAAAIVLTIPFLVMRWNGYIMIGLAAIAINAWFVVPWYLPLEKPAASDSDIVLMHANVLATNEDATRFIAFVEETDPDLLVMQEVTSNWLFAIEPIKSRYPYRVIESREDAFGIALYSKFPLDAIAVNESVPLGFPEIIATARIAGRTLGIISSHPIPPVGPEAAGSRNLQLDGVAQLARRSPRPLVVVGDLNVTMWSHRYTRVIERAQLRNAAEGFGIKPTWPLFLPIGMIPIDHVLVSDGIEVTGVGLGSRIGSDHLPLIVNFRLTNP